MSKAPADTYTHPDYSVSPPYCGLEYEYSIDLTTANENAVTQSGKVFSFFYNAAMADYSDTQTITVGGLSAETIYKDISAGAVTQGIDVRSFELSFVDPCITDGFVNVVFSSTTGDQTDDYSNSAKTFQVNYTPSPSWCQPKMVC